MKTNTYFAIVFSIVLLFGVFGFFETNNFTFNSNQFTGYQTASSPLSVEKTFSKVPSSSSIAKNKNSLTLKNQEKILKESNVNGVSYFSLTEEGKLTKENPLNKFKSKQSTDKTFVTYPVNKKSVNQPKKVDTAKVDSFLVELRGDSILQSIKMMRPSPGMPPSAGDRFAPASLAGDHLQTAKQKINIEHAQAKNSILNLLSAQTGLSGYATAESGSKIIGEYSFVFNGFAVKMSEAESKQVEKLAPVKKVYPNYKVQAIASCVLEKATGCYRCESNPRACYSQSQIPVQTTKITSPTLTSTQKSTSTTLPPRIVSIPTSTSTSSQVSTQNIQSNQAPIQNQNLKGQGIKVAVIDTGIDKTHPDLIEKVIAEKDFSNDDNDATDDNGHGTHVAGIIAGSGRASNGKYVGVAPDVKLFSAKVIDQSGSGDMNNVLKGIEWAANPDDNPSTNDWANILSISLGAQVECYSGDLISEVIDRLADVGILTVVAAGNSGGGGNMYSVNSPGCTKNALTVGSFAKASPSSVSSFSSRGPTNSGLLKPDILAPGSETEYGGQGIISTRAKGTHEEEKIDEYYFGASGTSMATPYASGSAAILMQAHPDWSVNEIKQALMRSTDVKPDFAGEYDLVSRGHGNINLAKALNTNQKPSIVQLQEISPNAGVYVGGTVPITAIAYGTQFKKWNLYLNSYGNYVLLASGNNHLNQPTKIFDLDTRKLYSSLRTLKLSVENEDGTTDNNYLLFNVKNMEITNLDKTEPNIFQQGDIIEVKGSFKGADNYQFVLQGEHGIETKEGISLTNDGKKEVDNDILGKINTTKLKTGRYFLLIQTNKIINEPNSPQQNSGALQTVQIIINSKQFPNFPRTIENEGNTFAVLDVDGDNKNELYTSGVKDSITIKPDSKEYRNKFTSNDEVPSRETKKAFDKVLGEKTKIFANSNQIVYEESSGLIWYYLKPTIFSSMTFDNKNFQGWPIKIDQVSELRNRAVSLANLQEDPAKEVIYTFNDNIHQLYFRFKEVNQNTFGSYLYVLDSQGKLLNNFPINLPGKFIASQAIADINEDGFDEIIILTIPFKLDETSEDKIRFSNTAEVYVFNRKGEVLLGWPRVVQNILGAYVAVGDFDGDKKADISVMGWRGKEFNNDGTPVYSEELTTVVELLNSAGKTINSIPVENHLVDSFKATDFDNFPGQEIILASSGSGKNVVVINYAGKVLSELFKKDTGQIQNLEVVDLNSDGEKEFIITSVYPYLTVEAFGKDGSKLKGFPTIYSDGIVEQTIVTDFDNDEKIDIILLNRLPTDCFVAGNTKICRIDGKNVMVNIAPTNYKYDKSLENLQDLTNSNNFFFKEISIDLLPTELSPSNIQTSQGGSFNVDLTVKNQGNEKSPTFLARYFLVRDEQETLVAAATFPQIDANKASLLTKSISVPRNMPIGNYQLKVVLNPDKTFIEKDYANNVKLGGQVKISAQSDNAVPIVTPTVKPTIPQGPATSCLPDKTISTLTTGYFNGLQTKTLKTANGCPKTIQSITGSTCFYHKRTGDYYGFKLTFKNSPNDVASSIEYPARPGFFGGKGGKCQPMDAAVKGIVADTIIIEGQVRKGSPNAYNTLFNIVVK